MYECLVLRKCTLKDLVVKDNNVANFPNYSQMGVGGEKEGEKEKE